MQKNLMNTKEVTVAPIIKKIETKIEKKKKLQNLWNKDFWLNISFFIAAD